MFNEAMKTSYCCHREHSDISVVENLDFCAEGSLESGKRSHLERKRRKVRLSDWQHYSFSRLKFNDDLYPWRHGFIVRGDHGKLGFVKCWMLTS